MKRSLSIVLTLVLAAGVVAPHAAAAATCASSVGPGIAPPAGLTFGIEGFHAAWYGQSGYMSLCPGDESTATVAYYNTGTRGWVLGTAGQAAYLGTSDPSPGQDQPSMLGGDGTNGSPATGWPRYNRLAVQPAPYVGPGQVAWFQFRIRAPLTPGRYSIALRPIIEGTQWMEDVGVFWSVAVLNPDGSPPPLTLGGLTFNVTTTARADIYVETTIPARDASSLVSIVDADVARVEADFGRTFIGRPVLFAFGSNATATGGNVTIAHLDPSVATFLARYEGGFWEPTSNSIFLNWFNLGSSQPNTTVRHELTHQLMGQILGPRFEAVPIWFHEGNARTEEFTIPGSTWWSDRNAAGAASAGSLSPTALIPLADLESHVVWNARQSPLVELEYAEASQAARFVREDVGVAGVVRILDLVRAGATFDAAFLAVTGKTRSSFLAAFPTRLSATYASYPGVALATDTGLGGGVTATAYGFSPSSSVTVTFKLPGFLPATDTRTTDSFGVASSLVTVAKGWPRGQTYTVTVSDGTRSVTSTTFLPAAVSSMTASTGALVTRSRVIESSSNQARPLDRR